MVTSPQIPQICTKILIPTATLSFLWGRAGWQASQVMWSVEETWYLVSVERYCEMNRCLVGKGELYYLGWAVKRVRWRARDSEWTQSEQSFHKEPWSSRLNPWKSHKHKCMSKHIPSPTPSSPSTHKHTNMTPTAPQHITHTVYSKYPIGNHKFFPSKHL